MIDRKILEAMAAGRSVPIPLDYTNKYNYDFECPKCFGSHFGSVYRGENSIYHCHDEHHYDCRWSGSKKECFVLSKTALAKELLFVYDKIKELESK